ncbi:terminase large subunit [Dehalococcoides mccartyi]|uniref:Terminase, large subunit n=1 Tax=Dehalococcoides mccartyi TaxID=61435 RepID=A0A142VA55_9CHLR|nr:terminase TerL endonuclease subunit [Dehalococcoides mccartyi]AMU86668.1 terminase, large subunit [Dehalococcoides mccartyi]
MANKDRWFINKTKPPKGSPKGVFFSQEYADHAVRFIQALKHTKGKWAGQPFVLFPWQRKIIEEVFGWRKANGTRLYKTVYVEIPKKNGKSELAAAVALYLLFADGEHGAEVYGAAVDRDQARIVFDVAADMVCMSPALLKRSNILDSVKRVVVSSTNSFYRVLSKEVKAKHGFNTSGLVLDELHAQPDRDLVDVLTKGAGAAREQPLFFMITTAGVDRESICREYHDKARDILDGKREEPTFYPVIYGPPEDTKGWDWEDENNWYDVNPSLGEVLSIDEMREAYQSAKGNPAEENVFKQLRLNMWISCFVKGMPMENWDKCGPSKFELEKYEQWCAEMEGQECYAALDLSSTTDLTSLNLVFPLEDGYYRTIPFFWLPLDNLEMAARRDRIPYPIWAAQKLVRPTPGNVVDYSAVKVTLSELALKYRIREIAFDPWNAMHLVTELSDEGYPLVEFKQSVQNMSPPTKELLRVVLNGKLQHGGNPVLRWNADNLQLYWDANDNVKPNKQKATGRIDGVVALIMALSRAISHSNETEPSVYESRGVLTL